MWSRPFGGWAVCSSARREGLSSSHCRVTAFTFCLAFHRSVFSYSALHCWMSKPSWLVDGCRFLVKLKGFCHFLIFNGESLCFSPLDSPGARFWFWPPSSSPPEGRDPNSEKKGLHWNMRDSISGEQRCRATAMALHHHIIYTYWIYMIIFGIVGSESRELFSFCQNSLVLDFFLSVSNCHQLWWQLTPN